MDDEDTQTLSTAVTAKEAQAKKQNKFELFEKFLSFLDTNEDLNPTLSGYFCKLFQVLVGNKPKEVFQYVYNHPDVLDNLVNHLYSKSICEILVRILNFTDNVFEESFEGNIESIRQSFIYKILQRLDPQYGLEDHLNAQQILSELADYKPVYQELVSPRCIELYKTFLKGNSDTSKANLYILFTSIVSKYKANEHFQKRINITSFEDGAEDMIIEEDEEMLLFKDDKESELS